MRIRRWPNSLKKWLFVVLPCEPRCRPSVLPPASYKKDQVEIAVIIRLAAAELAEREHDRLAGVAFAVGEALPLLLRAGSFGGSDRWAEPIVGSPNFSTSFAYSLAAICLRHASAMSASAACVERMSSLPNTSRTPTRKCWAFLKLCRIGSMSSAPWLNSASVCFEHRERRQVLDQQAVHQLVDHARDCWSECRPGTGRRHTASRTN